MFRINLLPLLIFLSVPLSFLLRKKLKKNQYCGVVSHLTNLHKLSIIILWIRIYNIIYLRQHVLIEYIYSRVILISGNIFESSGILLLLEEMYFYVFIYIL